MILNLVVLDFLTALALKALFEIICERFNRVNSRSTLLLKKEELFKDVREVLAGILLLTGLELFVIFADQLLEDGGADTILVELVLLFLCTLGFFTINDDFLSKLLLGVLA